MAKQFNGPVTFTAGVTMNGDLTNVGKTVLAPLAVTTYSGNDGSIPVTAGYANIDAGGSARSGLRFASAGTAGQLLVVQNSGGENLTFHNTDTTSLLRGTEADHDTMPPNYVGLFVSDGSRWNLIAGGVDTQPDIGLTAG